MGASRRSFPGPVALNRNLSPSTMLFFSIPVCGWVFSGQRGLRCHPLSIHAHLHPYSSNHSTSDGLEYKLADDIHQQKVEKVFWAFWAFWRMVKVKFAFSRFCRVQLYESYWAILHPQYDGIFTLGIVFQNRYSLVLATGPGNPPAVRVWTANTGRFGSRTVQQPDRLTLGGPNPDPYPSTRGFRRVWLDPSVPMSGSAFRVSHLWSHSDMLLLIVK